MGPLASPRLNLSNDLLAETRPASGSGQPASTVVIDGVSVSIHSTPKSDSDSVMTSQAL